MTETLTARLVLKNKYWIVESDQGEKIATIQAVDDGGYVYAGPDGRARYPSIKLLSKAHNVAIDNTVNKKIKPQSNSYSVYDLPVNTKPWNILYDVKHHFPIYTKTSKSKSYYCAGYYLIKFNHGWAKAYCPKFITLNRYEHRGPFKTKELMLEALKNAK